MSVNGCIRQHFKYACRTPNPPAAPVPNLVVPVSLTAPSSSASWSSSLLYSTPHVSGNPMVACMGEHRT